MPDKPVRIAIQTDPFDPVAEASFLTDGQTEVGAVVTFTGICRADETLSALELEQIELPLVRRSAPKARTQLVLRN